MKDQATKVKPVQTRAHRFGAFTRKATVGNAEFLGKATRTGLSFLKDFSSEFTKGLTDK